VATQKAGFHVNAGSLAATIFNLRNLNAKIGKDGRKALVAMGQVLHYEIKKAISHRDHTLADLRALGHPYAKRHAGIKIHSGKTYIVHAQSGKMLKALHRGRFGNAYRVWIDRAGASRSGFVYAQAVMEGTKIMHGRGTLWTVANMHSTKVAMMKAAVKVLGATLRTQSGIRFHNVSIRGRI